MKKPLSVVMMGATGAVGNHTALTLAKMPSVSRLTLLGRREAENIKGVSTTQHVVDVLDPSAYNDHLKGHNVAICTLGIGEPSKANREQFIRIDHDVVLDFAKACKKAGVTHFELLSSVGVSSKSKSFYLRTKGQLEDALVELGFERLTLIHPSLIITPTNRYGLSQAITLKVAPIISPLLFGPLRKFRAIDVDVLGKAIALNLLKEGTGVEILEWDDFLE